MTDIISDAEFYQRFGRDLLIAWAGTSEHTYAAEARNIEAFIDSPASQRGQEIRNTAKAEIMMATPKERLERYCEWHGILGHVARLYEIATS